jgi:hypothetical protein
VLRDHRLTLADALSFQHQVPGDPATVAVNLPYLGTSLQTLGEAVQRSVSELFGIGTAAPFEKFRES